MFLLLLHLLVVGGACAGLAGALPPGAPATPPALLTLVQDYWHWKTQDYPEFATLVGLNDNTAGRLDTLSHSHFNERKVKCEEFLSKAELIDEQNLSKDDLINLKIFKQELSTYIDNFMYIRYYAPINYLEGPQLSFPRLVKQMVIKSYDDYQKLLARYGEFPRQASEIVDLLQDNLDVGLMPSNWSMSGVVEQVDSLLVNLVSRGEDSIFYKPFIQMPLGITVEQRSTLREQADKRIINDLQPAFTKIRDFLQHNYLSSTRAEAGANSLPGGDEYYRACLKFHTSTTLFPQEIHTLGLNEVKRIRSSIDKVSAELGIETGSLSSMASVLQEKKDQQFTSRQDLIDDFKVTIFKSLYPQMEHLVAQMPIHNLTINETEDSKAPLTHYEPPSFDGSRSATFVINSKLYQNHSRYEITALAMHGTFPGHHLQEAYMRINPATPDFRKFIDNTRVADVPSKLPLYSVFREGWALYAEFLGEELGLYNDSYKRLGRLLLELFHSALLVVDTGIHALHWSREEAIEYLKQHSTMSHTTIENEINRYITFPGQAAAFKIGEMKIKELRQKAKNALGDLFSLDEFHNVVLQCTGPLSILEKCVTYYIERTIPIIHDENDDYYDEKENYIKNTKGLDDSDESFTTLKPNSSSRLNFECLSSVNLLLIVSIVWSILFAVL